jgi:transcriptional regulator GlxA family with amidase domain
MHFGTVPTIVDHLTRAHGFAAVALSADQTARVRSLADDVASHYLHPTLASPVHCDRALCELALMACDETPCHALPSIENLQRDKVARALSWCETHLELRPKVAHIAREVHVSPSHLRRLFWRHRGESPKAAFRHIQIESAVRELTTTSSCLDEIAARCGFANAAELSRLFKERFGMTAGRWRRKVIGPYKEPPRAESLSE